MEQETFAHKIASIRQKHFLQEQENKNEEIENYVDFLIEKIKLNGRNEQFIREQLRNRVRKWFRFGL